MEKIIYDTDIGGDCDDAGTLGMLHRLCDKGEAELLAVTHCFSSPYVAGCIDAINNFYGRRVPVGVNYQIKHTDRGTYAGALSTLFENKYPPEKFGTENGPCDTLYLLRKILSEAEDNSITLVVTGTVASMARLLRSEPDEISSLSGKEMIEKKLKRTVVMGGRFFESWPMTIFPDGTSQGNPVTWEWNIKFSDLNDVKTVCNEWNSELVFSSYEIGSYIKTMNDYPLRARKGDPIALAYEIYNRGKGRCSWDQTAMLEAVRPGVYWNYHPFGRIYADDDSVTHFKAEESGKHTYLLPKIDYEEIRLVIDDLMDGK